MDLEDLTSIYDIDFNEKYKGGFGTVYYAKRKEDQLPVALKVVLWHHVTLTEDGKVAFFDTFFGGTFFIYIFFIHYAGLPLEAKLLQTLKYVDGILHLLDVIKLQHKFILVLERPAESVDLFQYIMDKVRLEEQQAINFMKQIVSTLIEVDELGIYHGDIKDENIIVDMSSLKLSIIDVDSGDFYPDDKIFCIVSMAHVFIVALNGFLKDVTLLMA